MATRAAMNVKKAHPDWNIEPEIMIPLIGDIKELKVVKNIVVETADAEIKAAGTNILEQYEDKGGLANGNVYTDKQGNVITRQQFWANFDAENGTKVIRGGQLDGLKDAFGVRV